MLLIDDRAGSKSLISLPPLNSCTSPSCHGTFRLVTHTEGNFYICSSNDQSHEPLSSLCRLDSADVAFTGNAAHGPILIGIELKSITDLLSSAATGRLQATQLPAMLATYDLSYLLYYGNYRPDRNGNLQLERGTGSKTWRTWRQGSKLIPYSYLESFLMTVSALGVTIKHCASINDCALWIALAYKWWTKPWLKHRGLRTFDNTRNVTLLPGEDSRTLLRAKVAAQLPGIGFERAITVARSFTSIREMVCASRERWEQIEGIGKVIANSVQESVK